MFFRSHAFLAYTSIGMFCIVGMSNFVSTSKTQPTNMASSPPSLGWRLPSKLFVFKQNRPSSPLTLLGDSGARFSRGKRQSPLFFNRGHKGLHTVARCSGALTGSEIGRVPRHLAACRVFRFPAKLLYWF